MWITYCLLCQKFQSSPDIDYFIKTDTHQRKYLKIQICMRTDLSSIYWTLCEYLKRFRWCKINFETEKLEKICDDETVDHNWYVHIGKDENMMDITCFWKYILSVLGFDYRVISTFKDDILMSGPKAISLNQHHSMFVCNFKKYKKHNLFIISRNGIKSEIQAHNDDWLKCP